MVSQIAEAHQTAKKLYRHRLAPDYNVFDFIERGETRLSKILAWILDPEGTHGQGGRFLRLFLEALVVDATAEECDDAKVQTEFYINDGRLDILVSTSSLRLAIENKPWADDQDKQLTRYFAYLDTCGVPKYRVVYLTSKGADPPEHSITKTERERRTEDGQLHLWSYDREVIVWLAKCRAECQADRVSIFIEDFSRHIRKVFEGLEDRTMRDHLLDEITKSEDKVSGAMQVIFMADAIWTRLFSDLRQQLITSLPNHNVEIYGKLPEKWSGCTIEYSNNSPYQFNLQFEFAQFNGLVAGVHRKIKGSPPRGNEYDSMNTRFGTARQNPVWLWWRYVSPTDSLLPVPRDWHGSTEPWIEIANRGLASKIAKAFRETYAVLSDCGVG
jgi:hypothetical protein